LILGGAAVHRCDNRPVLNAALATEGAVLAQKGLFPQTLQPCRTRRKINSGFIRWGRVASK